VNPRLTGDWAPIDPHKPDTAFVTRCSLRSVRHAVFASASIAKRRSWEKRRATALNRRQH
jgi:hypothetical protein